MKITNKIMDQGRMVGVMINDADYSLPMCNRALYLENYIAPLTEDGYKYYSYSADEIEMPGGSSIIDLPAIDLAEIDEVEWLASIELANAEALTDSEASKYYSYKQRSVIAWKEPVTYMINTRSELIEYLLTTERSWSGITYGLDNRPINAITNPEALFTVDELIEHPELKSFLNIIQKRHIFRNYDAYLDTVKFLLDTGALTNPNPSMAEFISAYYAWGPEGIKDICTSSEMKLSVDGSFEWVDDNLTSTDAERRVFANRTKKMGFYTEDSKINYLKHHIDISEITDYKEFERARLCVDSNDILMRLRRADFKGKRLYPLNAMYFSDVSDRLYITLQSESGFAYQYKVSHDKVRFGLRHGQGTAEIFLSSYNFCVASIVPGVTIELENITDANDYFLWNKALFKAILILDARTEKAPSLSTSEFLLKDGVSPVTMINYMTKMVSRYPNFRVHEKVYLRDGSNPITNALDLYIGGVPEEILQAFQLTYEDIEGDINNFIDMADTDDLEDRRELMLRDALTDKDEGFDPTFFDWHAKYAKTIEDSGMRKMYLDNARNRTDAIDFYTKVKFVRDCIAGNLSIGNMGEGRLSDIGASYKTIAEVLMTALYAVCGDAPTRERGSMFIEELGTSDALDLDVVFRKRNNAYNGYLADFAEYRSCRASKTTWLWAYCSRVFREISNAPIEQQRPYLMELIGLDTKRDLPIRELATAIITMAIKEAGFSDSPLDKFDDRLANKSMLSCALSSAEFLAAKLVFHVIAGGIKSEPVDGNYEVNMDLDENITLKVKVPVAAYDIFKRIDVNSRRYYITVFDYCKYEYTQFAGKSPTGEFFFCLVNAEVDPWHVKPRKGYSIKSYPLLPNYYDQKVLDSNAGIPDYYANGVTNKAIIQTPIITSYNKPNFVPAVDPSNPLEMVDAENIAKNATELSELNYVLDYRVQEYIFAYVRRWGLARKMAKEKGKKLYSIPLKQDICLRGLAPLFCDKMPADDVVLCDDIADDRFAMFNLETKTTSWRDLTKTTMSIVQHIWIVRPFEAIKDILGSGSTSGILVDGNTKMAPINVSGNYLVVHDGEKWNRILVKSLTPEAIKEFVAVGYFTPIGEDKYFIHGVNGDFVVEHIG